MSDPNNNSVIKDSDKGHWVNRTPPSIRPYLQLSRLDRPVGYWLLALPGWIGLAFASLTHGFAWTDLKWAALILVGAIAMRGAGCTYNDIVDQDLDKQVERTALRPLPAGTVSNKQAWIWLLFQCFIGLMVLLCLPRLAQIISLASIPLVAAYPFMKRITWWPQLWLGMTFNWAVLVAYAAKTGEMSPSLFLLYVGLIFWTVGYDTIYACQDIEDDAMVGIKSTARRFGDNVKLGVLISYALCSLCIFIALHLKLTEPLTNTQLETVYYGTFFDLAVIFFLFMPFLIHLMTQVRTLKLGAPDVNLKVFKSNFAAAILLLLCCLLMTGFHYSLSMGLLGFTDTDLSVFE